MKKKIILRVLSVSLIFFCFITWGLYLIEIEDHYGDLQEVYFDAKNGDIIINKQTQKFGIITKTWKRADVLTKENDTLDLYELIYINGIENKYEVFKTKDELKISELSYQKIIDLKNKKMLETVAKN
ncbi:hypothetical protein BD847_0590 [Flavobacterium cutihirudinis]|uniref:Uncharacterized protein n=1 Tax=Flavobacterium cutihirudinis TaxID=1265740 RepID=A0A3D9G0C8_9FLAO|nr:hypothetical protein [Flavobacterium cutihirudinis]RED26668.1 hypothetical protein BD847_0590 [Flavobacterium cutihirudinis]